MDPYLEVAAHDGVDVELELVGAAQQLHHLVGVHLEAVLDRQAELDQLALHHLILC